MCPHLGPAQPPAPPQLGENRHPSLLVPCSYWASCCPAGVRLLEDVGPQLLCPLLSQPCRERCSSVMAEKGPPAPAHLPPVTPVSTGDKPGCHSLPSAPHSHQEDKHTPAYSIFFFFFFFVLTHPLFLQIKGNLTPFWRGYCQEI